MNKRLYMKVAKAEELIISRMPESTVKKLEEIKKRSERYTARERNRKARIAAAKAEEDAKAQEDQQSPSTPSS